MRLRDIMAGANASMYYRLDFSRVRGMFYPRSEDEVVELVRRAREQGLEVTPKGGGSGLSGACTGGNHERIVISSLRMDSVITVSRDQGYVDVQPGATPDEINALLEPLGMRFWVAPSSRDIATVGGILSTDGGGNDTWSNGTMRDNTLRVRMVLYNGARLVVDGHGVKCDDPEIEAALTRCHMTLDDVAASHGTLGFITELRLAIRPISTERLQGGLVEFGDYDAMGAALSQMIRQECPIRYGEAIVFAHDDVREDLAPPLLILEFPEGTECDLQDTGRLELLSPSRLQEMKDIRLKLPKRNPRDGIQVALFEGYGLHDDSLVNMHRSVEELTALLRSHGMEPFAKYGHAPSKWYLGDNTPAYGLIMHSREIRPASMSGRELFEVVMDIVQACKRLGITPKPEHKWPFSDQVKKQRLEELRRAVGGHFNAFIFDPDDASETLASMV